MSCVQAWWSCRIRRQACVLFYSACQESVYRYGISTTGGNFQVASRANGTVNRVRQTGFLGAIGELASVKAQPWCTRVRLCSCNVENSMFSADLQVTFCLMY